LKSTEINEVLDWNLENILISPGKINKARIVKIKEKVLQDQNDSQIIQEDSSFSNTYRSSIIPGEIQVTITTLITDSDSDGNEDECSCCQKCKVCSQVQTPTEETMIKSNKLIWEDNKIQKKGVECDKEKLVL